MSCKGIGSNLICTLYPEESEKPIPQEITTFVDDNTNYWKQEFKANGLSSQKQSVFNMVRNESQRILREVGHMYSLLGASRLDIDKFAHPEVDNICVLAASRIKASQEKMFEKSQEERYQKEMSSISGEISDLSPPPRHDSEHEAKSSLFGTIIKHALIKINKPIGIAVKIATDKDVLEGSESPMRDKGLLAMVDVLTPLSTTVNVLKKITSSAKPFLDTPSPLEDSVSKEPCLLRPYPPVPDFRQSQAMAKLGVQGVENLSQGIEKWERYTVENAIVLLDAAGVTDKNVGQMLASIGQHLPDIEP